MARIQLEPECLTTGGEASGIMIDGQYVGSLLIVFREQDRLFGSIQIDEEKIDPEDKKDLDMFMHQHIEHILQARDIPECFVTVSYSEYDHIIASDDQALDEIEGFEQEESPLNQQMDVMELVLFQAGEHYSEYELLDRNRELVALINVFFSAQHVTGQVIWQFEPNQHEIDMMLQLVISDFEIQHLQSFTLIMFQDREELTTIDLTRDDLFEFEQEHEVLQDLQPIESIGDGNGMTFELDLIRDDLNVLVYDVYERKDQTVKRVATTSVDLAGDDVTALVELIHLRERSARDLMVYTIIDELEEEEGLEALTVNLSYKGEILDEYIFEEVDQNMIEQNHLNKDHPRDYYM